MIIDIKIIKGERNKAARRVKGRNREDGKKKLEEDRKRVRREKMLLDKAQREMDVQKGRNLYDTYFDIDRILCLEKGTKRKYFH